ncbi:MAG: histidine phosphatase family protein [Acidimicrobiia bacterium]|nr:histidine phosphatase family protein [Acidimicrobiia bacterium]
MNLMLLRHGKSDWDAGSPDDHSRPLAPRGVRSARRMGEALRDLGLVPELVVSSSATRARSTAELARLEGGWDSRLVLDERLYGASVFDTLSVAEEHGTGHERIMLVGHEPTWSLTVHHVTGANVAMRTATCADMELNAVSWSGLMNAGGQLITLLQPRHFLEG